jgi:endoribonuclease Dicer
VTFFLVDRVPLVFQQANVIHSNIDARIEEMCGEMNTDSWSLSTWRDKIDNNDICVMTAQIFLDNLQRGFLSLDEVIINKTYIKQDLLTTITTLLCR